ncbi:hypothetical protein LIER_36316 [Lithospermum erythrorhizon]|uniref:Uncharacterized protein n=1 Tax=Lithospermum erythrorhizon TaxID=34254 RepID=A0AAV3P600_LITER
MSNKQVNPTPVDDPENSTPEQNNPITPTLGKVPPNPPDPDTVVVYRRIDPSSPYYLGSNDHPDEEKFLNFLYGLDAMRFGHLSSQLLAQDPTPSLDWAFQAMNQEEQLYTRNNVVKFVPEDVMTFVVNTQNKTNSEFKSRFLPNVTCTFCHRVGHEKATCFGKNGFPEWWGNQPQVRGRGGPGRTPNRGRGGAPPPRPRAAEARNFASWFFDGGKI